MISPSNPPEAQILTLVGAIVLSSQEAERYLKFVLPFADGSDPRLGSVLARARKLERRTLGELTGKLQDALTSDSPDFSAWLAKVTDGRNRVVHHFNAAYGKQVATGAHEEVLASLCSLLADIDGYRALGERMALAVMEGLRDVTYAGTPEQPEIAAMCEQLQSRVERRELHSPLLTVRLPRTKESEGE